MICRHVAVVLVLGLVLGCWGCQTSPQAPLSYVSASLVMPGPGLHRSASAMGLPMPGDPSAREYGRNDEMLNSGVTPLAGQTEWTEIRTRDSTRTSNGLPREYSRTLVRTVRRSRIP